MYSPEHVREVLSQGQINDWREYYCREPFGEYREDVRNALNIAWTKYPDGKRHKLQKFMPKFNSKKTPVKMTAEQLAKELEMFKELKRNGRKGSS